MDKTEFKYDELSDEAKAKAREWMRECEASDFDVSTIYDDAAQCLGFLGIDIDFTCQMGRREGLDIRYSGFGSQGDGASFEGYWRAKDMNLAGLHEHAPEDKTLHDLAGRLMIVFLQYPTSSCRITCARSTYSHSGCMECEQLNLGDGVEDEDDWDAQCGAFDNALEPVVQECADWIYTQLEAEFDYRTSDEACEENIRANDYTFHEDGNVL